MTVEMPDVRLLARDDIETLEKIFRLAPLGIGVVDLEGRTIMSNDTLCRWLGYTAEEFAVTPWMEFTHPDDIAPNVELWRRLETGELDTFTLEKRFIAKGGSLTWARLTSSMVRQPSGEPAYVIGIVEDITERKALEQDLRAAEEEYRVLVERVPAVVYIAEIGAQGRWRYVSPKIEKMLGFTAEEWVADPDLWLCQIHPEDRERALQDEDSASDGSFQQATPYRMLHRDGSVVWVRDDATAVRDGEGELIWHGVLVDVTREKVLEEELGHQAHHDPLTALPNRTLLHRRVGRALRRGIEQGTDVAVFFIDLDRFKDVNDSFGHGYGDQVIVEAARRIQSCIRKGDSVARLGGDEFALLAEGASLDELESLATRVLATLRGTPMRLGDVTVTVGASIGIAVAGPGDDADTLLRNADLAMYRAKRHGGGFAVPYQAELHDEVVTRFRTHEALQKAIAHDEIGVAYQPIVDLTTTAVVGLEALARWRNRDGQWVSPTLFIPMAEQSGLIKDLGRRMLHRACADLADWRTRAGRDAYVSINASPVQLDSTYVDDVANTLDATGLEPSALVIEVTEGVMLDPVARGCLMELRRRGVRVAIDDFGTGYSSLSYIRDLPVDIVKIDRSFLRPGPQEVHDQPVLRAVVDLINSLGLVSVLEGVETSLELATARLTRAHHAQGYLFGQPAALEELLGAPVS